jgi:hypothetical protein
MSSEMELVVDADGDVRCVYGEELDLREIGKLQITRASHVEPDLDGYWWADMGPVDGPVLGPFRNRTEALQAEREWLIRRQGQINLAETGRTRRAAQRRQDS